MVNKKLLSIILIVKIFAIHSFPYNALVNASNRTDSFDELNNTFRAFNKINGTVQQITRTNSPKTNPTAVKNLSRGNIMNETISSHEFNTIHLDNATVQLSTVRMNPTISTTGAVLNSTIGFSDLEREDPLVEILESIPVVNFSVSFNSTVPVTVMNSTISTTGAVLNWTIGFSDLERDDPLVEILEPIQADNFPVSFNSTVPATVMNSTIVLTELNLEKVEPVVEILNPIQELNLTVSFNSTVITELVEFDQNKTVHIRPVNIILNETAQENLGLNLTEFAEPIVSDFGTHNIYELNTVIKLVYIETFNNSNLSFCPHTIKESIKHAILKYVDSKLSHVFVNLTFNETIRPKFVTRDMLPIDLNVTIMTPIALTEDQFNLALVDYSINNKKCSMLNDTEIRCSLFRLKDSSSLLRISDYWIELSQLIPTHQKLNGIEYEIFTYKPAWIVGLAIIGGIIAIFFLGCIVAICYTRRPYRRCGKVYEIDSAVRKNNQPYIPGVHPATKAATVTKTKEMYYQ